MHYGTDQQYSLLLLQAQKGFAAHSWLKTIGSTVWSVGTRIAVLFFLENDYDLVVANMGRVDEINLVLPKSVSRMDGANTNTSTAIGDGFCLMCLFFYYYFGFS